MSTATCNSFCTYIITLASSMKSSSDIAPSLIVLMATLMVAFHLPSWTTPNCPWPSSLMNISSDGFNSHSSVKASHYVSVVRPAFLNCAPGDMACYLQLTHAARHHSCSSTIAWILNIWEFPHAHICLYVNAILQLEQCDWWINCLMWECLRFEDKASV